MKLQHRIVLGRASSATLALILAACGGNSDDAQDRSVTIASKGTNAVSFWNDIAGKTVNTPGPAATTPEEQRTNYGVDVATVQLAVYDAASAIDGRFKPYAVTPTAPATGASMEAAVGAAAYGVLSALFPNRAATYQTAYDSFIAAIPAGEARTKGLALGSEVGARMVALRANDGRAVVLAPYAPGTAPGQFRGVNPVNRFAPYTKVFALASVDQFRPAGPPALDSAAYATAFNEVKSVGGASSATRTADQLEMARFHTENPGLLWTRNLKRFAESTTNVADAARLMALIYVTHADATAACFDAKYFFQSWRPQSAIPLADTDNNAATVSDAVWTSVAPTPNHPEYPAAHSCASAALAEALRQYYGTRNVTFQLDSTVTTTARSYASTDALPDEIQSARIFGGMHFRFSTVDGAALGTKVANWAWARNFQPRN